MSITTKSGDMGTTALFGGERVAKSDPRIDACGSIDELTCNLGLVIVKVPEKKYKILLTEIQKHLYEIMAVISGGESQLTEIPTHTREIENIIYGLELRLPKLNQFILPGGSELSALFHISRAVCRRAERTCVNAFMKFGPKSPKAFGHAMQYINRVSDLLFMMAREYNGNEEIVAKTLKRNK